MDPPRPGRETRGAPAAQPPPAPTPQRATASSGSHAVVAPWTLDVRMGMRNQESGGQRRTVGASAGAPLGQPGPLRASSPRPSLQGPGAPGGSGTRWGRGCPLLLGTRVRRALNCSLACRMKRFPKRLHTTLLRDGGRKTAIKALSSDWLRPLSCSILHEESVRVLNVEEHLDARP